MNRVQDLHSGSINASIEWHVEALNTHTIFISFLEYGEPISIAPRWIDIIAQCLQALHQGIEIQDSISAYTSLLVELVGCINNDTLQQIEQLLSCIELQKISTDKPNTLTLPVLYNESAGQDLAYVAQQQSLSIDDVIRLHSNTEYQVYAVGFSPGFAFMGEIPIELHLPRRSTPRQNVPKGSVAIAENQTAIYPNTSPGGWHILGNCPVTLFDPARKQPNIFSIGQRVKFKPINQSEFNALLAENSLATTSHQSLALDAPQIHIIKSVGLTLVIDQGRQSAQQHGLSASGPMDSHAFYWANHLLGNHRNAPLLEVTMGGLSLTVNHDTILSITGADLAANIERADGSKQALTPWLTYRLLKHDILHIGHFQKKGMRTYIAFKGGLQFSHKPLFNSYSSVKRENLGGHKNNGSAIKSNDRLSIIPAQCSDSSRPYLTATPYKFRTAMNNESSLTIKVNLAYQAKLFSTQALHIFLSQTYTVSQLIDRMAYRLIAAEKITAPKQGIVSEGIALGSVQITPDGEPIILMRDRQTIGGYPKIAILTEEGVNALSQTSPGQQINFILSTESIICS